MLDITRWFEFSDAEKERSLYECPLVSSFSLKRLTDEILEGEWYYCYYESHAEDNQEPFGHNAYEQPV